MSRSIHTTRRSVAEIRKKKFADPKAKTKALEEARQRLRRKRLLKSQVLAERKLLPPPLAGTAVDTIPIEATDEGPWVHHAASSDDVRAVLRQLPSSATEGIARVRLHLGKEYMDEHAEDGNHQLDPFTGRKGWEIFPGVHSGTILGTFRPQTGLISVYDYVYDSARLPLPQPACEIYLRLHALKTLIHEVAHHHDEIRRVARGRWLKDREANVEWYAEKMEHLWTSEVVLPYLQANYPDEIQVLREWVANQGGLLLPLDFFSGDNRKTEKNGLTLLRNTTSGAFESWLGKAAKSTSLADSWLAFAWELHFSDAYDLCLVVLDRILAVDPGHVPAITCKADTLVHLERLDEAMVLVEHALRLNAESPEAWKTRGVILEGRHDWHGLLDNCDRWEAVRTLTKTAQSTTCLQRAIAHCALGDGSEMEKWLQAYLATRRFPNEETATRRTAFIRKRILVRAGKPLPPDLIASLAAYKSDFQIR